jgi:uncharacterized protein (DUF58 family)
MTHEVTQPRSAAPARAIADAERLAGGLPPLLVAAERVASTVSQGVHGRRRVGQGEAFWQFRRYEAGDPPQRIDWKQSAKADHVFVRQTEWEAAQSVWLWRDASASMVYRSQRRLPRKRERAELLLLALGSLLIRGGEHIAMLGAGDLPRPGRPALLRLASAMARENGTAGELPRAAGLPRHACVVLFGDFLHPLERLVATIREFTQRSIRGFLIQVLDPAEELFPFTGRILFAGSENEGEVLFGRAETVSASYRDALADHRRRLFAVGQAAGWLVLSHRTDHAPEAALLALHAAIAERKP